MFYEGTEKKLEFTVKSNVSSLRMLGSAFWQKMVAQANANVLSVISNEQCDAYLLSESSLFVWDNRVLMITCGTTTLIYSACYFIKEIGAHNIDLLLYQRKNEYLPQAQLTNFESDVMQLERYLKGNTYQLEQSNIHHHYIFYYRSSDSKAVQLMNRLQMYHISGDNAAYLHSQNQSIDIVRKMFVLSEMLPQFAFDDFLFSPVGYSVNGLYNHYYLTLHITPQKASSYVSIETNIDNAEQLARLFNYFVNTLRPREWEQVNFNFNDVISFSNSGLPINSKQLDLSQHDEIKMLYYMKNTHRAIEC